jgi:hypothetical protein
LGKAEDFYGCHVASPFAVAMSLLPLLQRRRDGGGSAAFAWRLNT